MTFKFHHSHVFPSYKLYQVAMLSVWLILKHVHRMGVCVWGGTSLKLPDIRVHESGASAQSLSATVPPPLHLNQGWAVVPNGMSHDNASIAMTIKQKPLDSPQQRASKHGANILTKEFNL